MTQYPVKKVYGVEVSGACNLEAICKWCPMHNRPRSRARGLMSPEVIERALSWVKELGTSEILALHNFGEPLLHPEFDTIAKRFAEVSHITMSTNGVLVDEAWADRLASVGFVYISISPWKPEAAVRAAYLLQSRGVIVLFTPGVTHSFAGQAIGPSVNIFNKCEFLRDGSVVIRWDGSLASCCISDREEDSLGSVFSEPRDIFMRSYSLCETCHHAA